MNRLSVKQRAQIIQLLVECTSIRATSRITGHSKNTIIKLLVDVGFACANYHDTHVRRLPCRKIQVDEIWALCYGRSHKLSFERRGMPGYGEVWTWVAICPDTKIVPCWYLGERVVEHAQLFLLDLASRMNNLIQLTSDGHAAYPFAVTRVFKDNVDYAVLMKLYGDKLLEADKAGRSARYKGSKKIPMIGEPKEQYISTSLIERQNLTMRSSMKRMARRTNAISKKAENLGHALALHYMYYNFARIHQTLRVTPAMEAGVAKHVWSLEEIAGLAA